MKLQILFAISLLILGSASGTVSKQKFRAFMQKLWDTDKDQVHGIKCQFQSLARFKEDPAELPLFLTVDRSFMARPTYKCFLRLLNNYIRDPKKAEKKYPVEIQEEGDFMTTICKTEVMNFTLDFLTKNGYFNGKMSDFEKYLRTIWFGIYPRSMGHGESSCGFEHVFVGEYKGTTVNGLHNWVQFYLEERSKKIDYKGYIKYRFLEHNITLLTNAFTWEGHKKVKGGMFIGTSPEMELAMYTICFMVSPNKSCVIPLDGVYIAIVTYQTNYKGVIYVSTAFPVIL